MYAGQVRVGIIWLVVTLLGDAAFLALMFTGFTGYAGDLSGIAIISGFASGIGLVLWLIVRFALAGSYVQAFNADARQQWRRQQQQQQGIP